MLPLVLALSLLSGQARDAGTPWPFVGTSPVMRYGPPSGSGVLARYLNPTQGTVSFSGVTFTRSSAGAACTAADGSVTFPASGVPCLAGGYHARPQIADLATNTAAFDNAAWLKQNVSTSNPTVAANATASPDGTATADSVAFPAVGAGGFGSFLTQDFTATAAPHSAGVYLKGASASGTVYLMLFQGGVLGRTACAFTAAAWTLCKLNGVTLAATSASIRLGVDTRDANQSAQPAQTVYAWGAGVYQSAIVPDYCPSGSTPATCAAEVATVPTPSGISRTSGCSKVCVTSPFAGSNPSGGAIYLLAGQSPAVNLRLAYMNPGVGTVLAYDGTSVAAVAGGLTAGTRACFLTQWSAAGSYLRISNLTAGTNGSATFTTLPAFDSTLPIGNSGGSGQPLGAVIDSIVIGSSPGACQ